MSSDVKWLLLQFTKDYHAVRIIVRCIMWSISTSYLSRWKRKWLRLFKGTTPKSSLLKAVAQLYLVSISWYRITIPNRYSFVCLRCSILLSIYRRLPFFISKLIEFCFYCFGFVSLIDITLCDYSSDYHGKYFGSASVEPV